MLRDQRHEDESHICGKNRIEKTAREDQPKRENDAGDKYTQKHSS